MFKQLAENALSAWECWEHVPQVEVVEDMEPEAATKRILLLQEMLQLEIGFRFFRN